MNNETVISILGYADTHHNFSIEDLYAHLHKKIGINRSALSWYLFKLVNENRLVRTGRGMYAEVMKQTFAPKPVKEVKEIYELLHANFPFAKFCVYKERLSHLCNIIFHLTASSMRKRTETRQKLFLIF